MKRNGESAADSDGRPVIYASRETCEGNAKWAEAKAKLHQRRGENAMVQQNQSSTIFRSIHSIEVEQKADNTGNSKENMVSFTPPNLPRPNRGLDYEPRGFSGYQAAATPCSPGTSSGARSPTLPHSVEWGVRKSIFPRTEAQPGVRYSVLCKA